MLPFPLNSSEGPTAYILPNSLLGEYSEGIECLEHHCLLSPHLQYNVTSDVEWKILETTDNTALEELYCDEIIEGIFKLNPAQAIEGSFFPSVISVGLYHMRSKITEC